MTRFAFIADDFTGATDALWQFQRFGLRTELIVDIGELEQVSPDVDVIGVATTLRSLPAEEMEPVFAKILAALVTAGARIIQYKVCSTFDSSPEIGSIGRVIDVARARGDLRGIVPVMPAQPELGRYTIFSHHFARYGDSDAHRIDRHPVMRDHPVTPARESDLRAVLAEQTASRIGGLHTVLLSDQELLDALHRAEVDAEAVVVDVVTDDDARRIGTALLALIEETDSPLFAVGSGGLSWALAHALTAVRPARTEEAPPPTGGVLALSGSRSSITGAQIDVAEKAGWLAIDLAAGEEALGTRAAEAIGSGQDVILYASRGRRAAERSMDDVGHQLATAAARCLDSPGLGRLVLMGGDTSGEILEALGVTSIRLRTMMPPSVPLCTVTSTDPRVDGLEVALKGGQLGRPDYLVSLGSSRR